MKIENIFTAIKVAATLGLGVTSYLIYQHFEPTGSAFCNINDFVNCDIVNKSKYAEIFGIPVSILGFLTYLLILIATFWIEKTGSKNLLMIIFGLCIFGLIFSLVLTYIEIFVLFAICLFCVAQQIIILILTILFSQLWLKEKSL